MGFPDLNEGVRIGRFRLERALGSGGMGAVWAARFESEPEASFALKILHPEVAARPEARQRLAREAKASNLVDHPGVARVREVMEIEDELISVMDLLEGETLRERMRNSGALPASMAAPLAAQVASALRAAHDAGVVHRDIKPENIFLTRAGESGKPVALKNEVFASHALVAKTGVSAYRTEYAGIRELPKLKRKVPLL